jgi:hypothetical protein
MPDGFIRALFGSTPLVSLLARWRVGKRYVWFAGNLPPPWVTVFQAHPDSDRLDF